MSVTRPVVSVPMTPYLNQIKPWVTVICTSYNQEAYVELALQSVADQTYPNVELIVIDNASSDQTARHIRNFVARYPATQYIQNPDNVGLCRAFNQGLSRAGGRYIIDLSADDVLLPARIDQQVQLFERLPADVGVAFSNAACIDANGQFLRYHYSVDQEGHALDKVPEGWVYEQVLATYFICTPTMMMRKAVLHELGGYDESLSYEDFDFWVRSARQFRYAYLDQVLTQKRLLTTSLASQAVLPQNRLLESTLVVCHKALERCRTTRELKALARRVRFMIRRSFYAEQFELALQFGALLRQIERPGFLVRSVLTLSKFHVPVNSLYRHYLNWRRND